ncbi:MAG: class I SAM-dependent methyltransferase [Fimbriimonas sp.]|nr:class I SAM-dependent methyltransferase [Fimbriimonas sp.]
MASPQNPVGSWSDYYTAALKAPLHPLYEEIDKWLPQTGMALELGAGVGNGVVHLIEKGLTVTAVDAESEAIQIIRERAPEAIVIESLFQDLSLSEETYDVVVAGFSLFFLTAGEFIEFWPRLVSSVRAGGIIAGQLMGPHDDWVARGYSAHSHDEAWQLLSPFVVLHFEEAERDGQTTLSTPKHWHVHHFVARKPD